METGFSSNWGVIATYSLSNASIDSSVIRLMLDAGSRVRGEVGEYVLGSMESVSLGNKGCYISA